MKHCKYLLFILVILSIPVDLFPQEFRTVQDGLEYAEVTKEISGLKVNMNLLRLDLAKVRLDVVHAMDAAIGVEKTSSLASRYGAIAAINAGFFRLDNSLYAGDAAGVLMIDGKLYSEPENDRIALLIANTPERTVANIQVPNSLALLSWKITGENKKLPRPLSGLSRWYSGINRERKKDELILYTPEFHRTTLTGPGGLEFTVENNKVRKISVEGNSVIPQNGFVLSADGSSAENLKENLKLGAKVEVLPSWFLIKNIYAEDVVGGVPQLIRDGKIDITWEAEKASKSFFETRHPRTAVAKLKDGKFLMITIDGRSESSGGIGLQDLAEYLLSLGAVDAMNLDGGGSTTMWLDGKVVNKPSDKEGERRVSDALIVRKR